MISDIVTLFLPLSIKLILVFISCILTVLNFIFIPAGVIHITGKLNSATIVTKESR
jgi:hypothetical protein